MTESKNIFNAASKRRISRRSVLASAAAAGVAAGVGPNIVKALGEVPVKIGEDDPFTGTYAALGHSQHEGAMLALGQINKAGGILGRKVEIIAEDNAADVGKATTKFHKLVDKDKVDFVEGSVSSAVALACEHAAALKGVLYVATGGHVDSVTGTHCNWTTFKTCSDTWMLNKALASVLLSKYGKRWYFSTPDYAWGHFLYAGMTKILKQAGGTNLGNLLMPLGTTDFTAGLIKIKEAKPDVLIVFNAGNDFVNLMKQATQFGMTEQIPFGYSLIELEPLAALPAVARTGWGVMEWWWDQPNNPHVQSFVAEYRKLYKKTPSARSWLGFATTHAIAMAANDAKTLNPIKVSHSMAGMKLPPEVALGPYQPFYRAADHQCMITEFVGQVNSKGTYPNLFTVDKEIPGVKLAASPEEKGCKMTYPA